MDGTLLNNLNQLTKESLETIQTVRQKGVRVFIVTGRSLDEVFDSAPIDMELDGFVTANGMITYIDGEKIAEYYLTPAFVQQIIQSAREHQIYYEAHPNDGQRLSLEEDYAYMSTLINGDKPDDVGLHEWLEREAAMAGDIDWVEELPDQKYAKLYCFHPNREKMEKWIKVLEKMKKQQDFTTSSSSYHNVEVMVEGVNKATGIKALLNHYQISPADTMAIGDSNNDIPMMQYIGYPVAMKNATDKIKQLSVEKTLYTNHENGVHHYLEYYLKNLSN